MLFNYLWHKLYFMGTIDLEKHFSTFNQQKILIIGDVMIDAYMWGSVSRISPEAPVPIIAVEKRENRLGGAANVGLNVRALGAQPIMCSVVGDDDAGAMYFSLLQKRGMEKEGTLVHQKRKTTIKTRVIGDSQHMVRVDEERIEDLTLDIEADFIAHISRLFEKFSFDAVIFEDYDKGTITPKVIEHVVKLTKEQNIPVLVDPKKDNFLEYKGVTLFKPNFKEIVEGLKIDIPKGDFNALHNASERLKEILGAEKIMVTLSELGVFITNGDGFHQIPSQVRDIADVSGAGDTVIAVLSCCLAAGMDNKSIAAISNIAGGLVCEKVGVVPVDKEALLKACVQYFKG
jgi:rfaE bifunctional protein kinase chain/domain